MGRTARISGSAESWALSLDWAEIFRVHARRYPRWQIPDVYKLAYQAVFGAEHALKDVRAARAYLEDEWAHLTTSFIQAPLFEPLRPDSGLGRLHLRPYKAQGGDLTELFQRWMLTAERVHGTVDALREVWHEVECLARSGELPFALSELDAFWNAQAAHGFPPVHHSSAYRSAYAPAYRVVLAE